MLRQKTYFLNLVLVISILITATFTSISLASFNVSEPEQRRQSVSVSTSTVRYGTLVVFVLLGVRSAIMLGNKISYFGPLEIPNYFRPIASENVSVSRPDSANGTELVLTTNSSGAARGNLQSPGNYLVSISEQRFHITIPARVVEGKTTIIVVAAHMLTYEVFYQFVQDKYSTGWASPSENVYLAIRSTQNIVNASDFVILQTERNLTNTSQPKGADNLVLSQTGAVVHTIHRHQNLVWLEVQPVASFEINDMLSMVIVFYRPTYTIITKDN